MSSISLMPLRNCIVLIALIVLSATTMQTLVQSSQAAPLKRGISCDWHMGACDDFHAYVDNGGKDAECRSILENAVDAEADLIERSGQNDNSPSGINDLRELYAKRAKLLDSLPTRCFADLAKANEDPKKYDYKNVPGRNAYIVVDRRYQKTWIFNAIEEYDGVLWTLDRSLLPEVRNPAGVAYQARAWYTAGRNRRTFSGHLVTN